MGKQRKGFNWKARQQPVENESGQEKQPVEKVKLDLSIKERTGYEDSNMLVLSTGPKKKKKTIQNDKKVKRLTKKQRKQLEKVVEQKEKKAKRASLMESLAAHQATKEEMHQLVGIAEIQTGALKRKLHMAEDKDVKVNSISGCNKKKQKLEQQQQEAEKSDSEESVHTSDMSSDEEEEGVVDKLEDKDDTEAKEQTSEIKTKLDKSVKLENVNNEDRTKQSDDKVTSIVLKTDVKAKLKEKEKGSEQSRSAACRKSVHVPVARAKSIQDARLKLPILGEEQVVMETINENPVVIICGETGSGKTTQVPQFLYEAGYAHGGGIIGITEPRRVAAVSMSNRVATEMYLTSRVVSYQIRYEGNVTPDTKIKFMTDGVLLKEVQKDFLLTRYSVIIIDEAHERSMYTDILIGLLSRIVPLRHKKENPLKLIIMSATLRVEDFTENRQLFKTIPPVVKVDARQFPVTIHYNKRTPTDTYLNEAYKKTCKIHRMLPEGGILVFVTGQQEVHTLCRKLKQTYPRDDSQPIAKDTKMKKEKKKRKRGNKPASKEEKELPKLPNISLDNYSVAPLDEEAEMEGASSDLDLDLIDDDDLGEVKMEDEDEDGFDMETGGGGCSQPLYVLPLYSLLSSENQAKVFGPVPEGCRLCVVATNVAETSLTIPNIKYVVDSGKVKTKFYDKVTGVSTFKVTWTSKAGANQRAGRAGRVGPGHCYRLYSSAVFNDDFEKFSVAEITRRPVDDLMLQMKDMNIDKVINFPYPTPPDPDQIKAAELLLLNLEAVKKTQIAPRKPVKRKKGVAMDIQTTITPLGRAMACFPVSPRYAKMLALGHQQNLLPYVVAIVSALSVQELFEEIHCNPADETQNEVFKQKLIRQTEVKRRWADAGHSLLLGDLMVMLKAVGACEYAGASLQFCEEHGIRYKAMKEVRKLRMQLTNTVNTVIPEANICVDPKMTPPDDVQAKLLRQIVLAGMGDHVARKLSDLPPTDKSAKQMKYAYQCMDLEDPVFIHPTSVLYRRRPEFIVYQSIQETSKLYMKGIVAIDQEWLPVFAPGYANLSKPLEDPIPEYDEVKGQVTCYMMGTFGPCSWPLPATQQEYPKSLEKIKWFARFLLEGKVYKSLMKFQKDYLSSPSTMVKSWAKLQPRTETLLHTLVTDMVDSRESLDDALAKKDDFLVAALKSWLPQSQHEELTKIWPPVKKTCIS